MRQMNKTVITSTDGYALGGGLKTSLKFQMRSPSLRKLPKEGRKTQIINSNGRS